MKTRERARFALFLTATMSLMAAASPQPFGRGNDPRNILAGALMMQSNYLDQPYCVVEGSQWLCTITQDAEHEGGNGERVLAFRSTDGGVTWGSPVQLEPGTSLTNAYSALLHDPSNKRVYCVYNMNVHNVSSLPSGKPTSRTDELGVFRLRFSDDFGATWSAPLQLPLPVTAIDVTNTWQGRVQIFWNVDVFHTWAQQDASWPAAGFFFTKMGVYPQSPPEEVFVMWSPDLLRPGSDPSQATWLLAPNSSAPAATWRGMAPPNGNPTILEEPHLLPVPSGGFYMVGRTTQGLLAAATSQTDAVWSWPSTASFARFWVPTAAGCNDTVTAVVAAAATAAGASKALSAAATSAAALGLPSTGLLKNPRGPTMMKHLQSVMLANGTRTDAVLLLFYANSHTSFDDSRNPYFLTAGTLLGREMVWAQPEVVLFNRLRPTDRPGYPDMNVRPSDGAVIITETNKTVSRAHTVPVEIVTALVQQRTTTGAPNPSAVVAEWTTTATAGQGETVPVSAPGFASFSPFNASSLPGDGLSLEVWLQNHSAAAEGQGIVQSERVNLTVGEHGALMVRVAGETSGSLTATMDAQCATHLTSRTATNVARHVVVVLDSPARLVTWVVDGVACDGGADGTNGWSWFGPDPTNDPDSAAGVASLRVGQGYEGRVMAGRAYNAALLVSDAVASFRHGFN